MSWERTVEEMVEQAEMAWETSLSELAAFGCIEFEEGVSYREWDELEDDPMAEFAFDCAGWGFDELYAAKAWPSRSIDLCELY